mmetsp:Transcript_43013/g.108631  ORF Transcript_43013/g.108631 Transcript_43013/m.108631 type:complete len:100 (-) Transcript_43013:510-809(-)
MTDTKAKLSLSKSMPCFYSFYYDLCLPTTHYKVRFCSFGISKKKKKKKKNHSNCSTPSQVFSCPSLKFLEPVEWTKERERERDKERMNTGQRRENDREN